MLLKRIHLVSFMFFFLFLAACGEDATANQKASDNKAKNDVKTEKVAESEVAKQPEKKAEVIKTKTENQSQEVTATESKVATEEIDNTESNIPNPSEKPFSIKGKYIELENPQPTDDPNMVEVLGFFAYSCGHCFNFHTNYLDKWKVPEGVNYQNVPLLFGSSVKVVSRAYHTAVVLGIEHEYHKKLFIEYRKHRRKYQELEAVAELATEFGVSKQEFIDTYNSFVVDMRYNKVNQLARDYNMHAVPTVVVNGKYIVKAGSHAETIKVMDELIRLELEKKK